MNYRTATQLLFDLLDDLHLTERVPTRLFEKKKGVRGLVAAINQADITISAARKFPSQVALYVPKDTHVITLSKYGAIAAQGTPAMLEDPLFTQTPQAIDHWLHQRPWLTITAILSSKIEVYSDHPSQTKHAGTIPRLNKLNAGCPGLRFDIDSRTIRLAQPFDNDVFLIFNALLRPHKINTRSIKNNDITDVEGTSKPCQSIPIAGCTTPWKNITVLTPPQHERLLFDLALTELLPTILPAITPDEIELRTSFTEYGNGPSVFTPKGQYSYY